MRILFVLEYYPPHVGGGETLFSSLARGLARSGHTCAVITARLPGTRKKEIQEGVELYRVPVPARGDRHWFTAAALPLAAKLARDADVVHTMTYNGAPPAWLAAGIRRRPAVLTVHEVVGGLWTRSGLNPVAARAYSLAERILLNLPFDAYPANSESTKKALLRAGIPGKKIRRIYPGVDLPDAAVKSKDREADRAELGFSPKDFGVLYFGRPGVVKGVEVLLDAAFLAMKEEPAIRLGMILSNKPREGWRRVMEKSRLLGERVRILPPVDRSRLPGLIRAADCVAVPSLSEGFGFTAAEASVLGAPVAATRAGSLPEVVSGRHVLVSPGDPAALARGILRLFHGQGDYRPVKVFSVETMVKEHEKLYRELLS